MNVASSAFFVAFAIVSGASAQTTSAPQGNNPPPAANQRGPNLGPPQTNTDYDISTTWYQLPQGMELGSPLAVASDGKGHILFFRDRANPPIVVFDRAGKYIRGWGDGLFKAAHSIGVDRNGFVWTTDNQDNTVYKFTMDGKLLMTLGKRGVAGDNASQDALNGPSNVAIARNGNIFVTDGYRNSRIMKFSKDGKFLKIIGGTKGKEPGQFDLPHAIGIDSKGRLIVTDRNNGRVQVFDQDGTFIEQWTSSDLGIRQPSGISIEPDDTIWVGANEDDTFIRIRNGKVIETIKGIGGRSHIFTVDRGVLYDATPLTPAVKRVAKKK
jgi:glucose/arabinose dehydrogenase